MENLLTKIEPDKEISSENLADISKSSFAHFYFGIFALGIHRVDGAFAFGKHLVEWSYRLQRYAKTATVSARYHVKTTTALAKLAWHIYRMDLEGLFNEWNFMSYKEDLAGHHLKRAKRYIAAIPEYFSDCHSLTTAETILHYEKNGCEFVCEPIGVMSFKRGLHPRGLICDDILKDPEVKLDIAQLLKIEQIFREQIMSMPMKELHVFGTPQDEADLFSYLERTPTFNCKRYLAEVNSAKKIALWPEYWPWERLMQQKEDIGEKAYNKEFLCSPARSEDGYFTSLEIDEIIGIHYKNYGLKKSEDQWLLLRRS